MPHLAVWRDCIVLRTPRAPVVSWHCTKTVRDRWEMVTAQAVIFGFLGCSHIGCERHVRSTFVKTRPEDRHCAAQNTELFAMTSKILRLRSGLFDRFPNHWWAFGFDAQHRLVHGLKPLAHRANKLLNRLEIWRQKKQPDRNHDRADRNRHREQHKTSNNQHAASQFVQQGQKTCCQRAHQTITTIIATP